ncbi:MAG: S41 family peptidase [Muribaculaceae bacterium]|jgi:carboxyl-terminal processing protease|nr:S41 family peptidase [Muribaculaceae bacterium]
MNNRKYMLWLPLTAAIFLIAGIALGSYISTTDTNLGARHKLNQVFDIISENYVDEVSADSLVEMALPELLKNLDPHSAYIPRSERVAVNRDLEGSFFGIGIQFQMMNDTLYVLEVISGGAAEEAGMLAGDRIIAVDGDNIAGVGVNENDIFSRLRGPEGTPVEVTVARHNSPKPLVFDLVRSQVPVSPIDASYMINDSVGFVRLSKFSDNTFVEALTTFSQLKHLGATSFILDLRGNGGGYMAPAVLVANEFLGPQDIVVSTRGRSMGDNRTLFADGSGTFRSEKLVVLVDEFSASSSEILSGAIQDNDRGLIVGRRTFGKGLVQQPFELPDSSEFRLTVQRYYTPSGRCIQKKYTPGHRSDYDIEVYDRYNRGEIFSADSIPVDSAEIFTTRSGRKVYGGGGIIPDIFVPSDTTGVTSYFIKVANAGLLRKFAYEYADLNRDRLNESENAAEMLSKLPSDYVLLQSFVNYANTKGGIAPRWYYINISAPLIVNQIKALIARDILGLDGYFEVVNANDPVVQEALKQLRNGGADFPLTDKHD